MMDKQHNTGRTQSAAGRRVGVRFGGRNALAVTTLALLFVIGFVVSLEWAERPDATQRSGAPGAVADSDDVHDGANGRFAAVAHYLLGRAGGTRPSTRSSEARDSVSSARGAALAGGVEQARRGGFWSTLWNGLRRSSHTAESDASSAPGSHGSPVATTASGPVTVAVQGAGQGGVGASPGVSYTYTPPTPAQQAANQVAKITRGLDASSDGGFVVTSVSPGSAAEQVGLKPGDVVRTVNGTPVASAEEFAQIYEQQGKPRQIEVVRDGRVIHNHP